MEIIMFTLNFNKVGFENQNLISNFAGQCKNLTTITSDSVKLKYNIVYIVCGKFKPLQANVKKNVILPSIEFNLQIGTIFRCKNIKMH